VHGFRQFVMVSDVITFVTSTQNRLKSSNRKCRSFAACRMSPKHDPCLFLACAYGQRTVTFEHESHAPGELGKSCSSLAVRTTGAAKQRQVAVLQQSEHKILPELIRQQGNEALQNNSQATRGITSSQRNKPASTSIMWTLVTFSYI
jgi:hypothetical protein